MAINGMAIVGMHHDDVIQLLVAQAGVDLIVLRAGPLQSADEADEQDEPTTFVASVKEQAKLNEKSKYQNKLTLADVQAVRHSVLKKTASAGSISAASYNGYRTDESSYNESYHQVTGTVHTESAL